MADKKKPTQTGWFAGCTGQVAAPSVPLKAPDGVGFVKRANEPLPRGFVARGSDRMQEEEDLPQ